MVNSNGMKHHESVAFLPSELQRLKKLVAQGEGSSLEFKRKAAFPEKIVREMIAFANTKGGTLLLGIGDDKSLPGLKYPEEETYVVREALQKCKPKLVLTETIIPVSGSRAVVHYEIPESRTKPHAFVSGNAKEIFVRHADKSIKASREMREILRRSQRKKDVRFHFGEVEKKLMQYLDEHATITLTKFCEVAKIRRYIASRKLVLLVLADVLVVKPDERGDVYSLAYRLPTKNRSGL
jgi:predicted HTH transcriptional regulator